MGYTLDRFAADCRAELSKDPGPAGRELVRQYEMACSDPDFVAKYLGPDAEPSDGSYTRIPTSTFAFSLIFIRGPRVARLTITAQAGRSTVK